MPKGIIANSDNSNLSFKDILSSIVSIINVTKLPANVAKLREHQIMAGMIFLIFGDINNLKVSLTWLSLVGAADTSTMSRVLKLSWLTSGCAYSCRLFSDSVLTYSEFVSLSSSTADITNIVEPPCMPATPPRFVFNSSSYCLGGFNNRKLMHPRNERTLIAM